MAWGDRNGVAKDSKSPRIPKYLKQIGFEIADSQSHQASVIGRFAAWGKALDPIFRHPVTLILISSLLTLGIGSWLTANYQERLREREATARSMDELRSAIDDVSLAFEQYSATASNLIALREQGASPNQLEAAQASYEKAANAWHLKYFGDAPNIRQRMPGNRGGDATVVILTELYFGSVELDTCLGHGKVQDVVAGGAQKEIACALRMKGRPELSADKRIIRLTECAELFHVLIRPDPKNDFDSEAKTREKLGGELMKVHNSCVTTI